MRLSLTSTSTRTFLALPLVAIAEAVATGRKPRPMFTPMLAWGYAQYRLCGDYRTNRGGGGPGMRRAPVRIVRTGPYAVSRNPMYLGHLIFLAGLTLTIRSRLVGAITLALVPWFDAHAARDELRLVRMFGEDYARYRDTVPRWLPRPHLRSCVAGGVKAN
ncbi:MAG: methyltransferase family protein [Sciscionella sp.]